MRQIQWLMALGLALSLSACSTMKDWFGSDDEDPTQPVELVDIEQTVKIKKRWSVGVGDGQGKGLYQLQPIMDGNVIYAASSDGEVKAIERERGKVLWKTELDDSLSGGVGFHDGYLLLGGGGGQAIYSHLVHHHLFAGEPIGIAAYGAGQLD